ncbi:metallophosphoesterase [Thalassotalea psychrophila]|uniref:Metallophosphoesterase n=1 Tax=Thalassotalea psychrophila TaxID=3065647 RepID=A0ABY9TS37_9GAMM|nr:metallophosphoesterase [Colwelliaceae bacterium SQ149]
MNHVTIAQFSDCHLFSTKDGMHYGHNVFTNLSRVLAQLANIDYLHAAIFTGDLTQDHSVASYQLFNQAVIESNLSCPVYWLAGNHDEFQLLSEHLTAKNIQQDKNIIINDWCLQLIDSKSSTPAGLVSETQLNRIRNISTESENTLIFMHHHAIDVDYFIDKHGLKNQMEFWRAVSQNSSIKAICCGHIHRGLNIAEDDLHSAPLYTCPATSIQFDPKVDSVAALNIGPGYRLLKLFSNGRIETSINHLSK